MSYFTIAFLFLVWRSSLFLPLIFSEFFIEKRAGYGYTVLTYFLEKGNILSSFLLYPFANFDGAYYLLIAAKGYTVSGGFFPLFPLLINVLTRIFGTNILPFDPKQYLTASLLVNVFFLLSIFLLFKLIRFDFKENVALWSIFFLLIFPTSFFYVSIYSESLFLFLSLLMFYFARKKMWFWASITGVLLTATRLVGITVWPALLYEYFKENKNKLSFKILPLFLVPLGLISYAIFNFYKWGNPFYFIAAQGNFQNNRSINSIVFLPQTIFRYLKILFTVKPIIYEWWTALLEIIVFLFCLIFLFIAWKRKIRFSYLIFAVLAFLIPSLTGTFSGLPRYTIVLFPIFIALALVKNKIFKIIYSAICLILLFLLFSLFSKGYFIA